MRSNVAQAQISGRPVDGLGPDEDDYISTFRCSWCHEFATKDLEKLWEHTDHTCEVLHGVKPARNRLGGLKVPKSNYPVFT